ncbi:TonB family protein [Mucilaginibacter mali]|uniref:TonB family protein n=1 Tax=Mucilaginibacter mali TaxID=2740462 RepID=A0A7D4TV29_9SPHI|nr:energy transducer TonB [Mucilaginibacter mali]QKJ30215.1 TonB family protein [Mucilaginibacter mali]
MLKSEFNLYNREWLSLVFKGRNQNYGAYELRRSYPVVLNRAMAVTFFTVAALCITETVISRNRAIEPVTKTVVLTITPPEKIFEAKLQKEQPKPKEAKPKTEAPKELPKPLQVSTQNINYVVKPDKDVIKDPEPIKADVAIGPEDKIVPGSGSDNVPLIEDPGTGEGVKGGNGDGIINVGEGGLQVMPEPIGGDKAWAKFLQKNLRFPGQAQDAGVSGRVYLSFIIEKDGHLSNITVERKAGYGFDEEASRVLKLAPAWKPGMQNGQAVRVRYLIPINFQLAE